MHAPKIDFVMAKLKKCIRKNRIDKEGLTPVFISVTHAHKVRYIDTKIRVKPSQFRDGEIDNHPKARLYNIKLNNLKNKMDALLDSLSPFRLQAMSMQALLELLRRVDGNPNAPDFFKYAAQHIANLQAEQRHGYADTFRSTVKMVGEILQTDYLPFADITPILLASMARKMNLAQLSPTTTGIYMRNIRTLFNAAIADPEQAVTYNDYPFREFKIPKSARRRINLAPESMRVLINFKPQTPAQQQALDLFLCSFYLIGINFKDLLLLRPTDVFRGRIIYDRAKTKKPYSILIQPEAAEILERYAGTRYLLNIMEKKEAAQKNPYRKSQLYKDITDQANKEFRRLYKNFTDARQGTDAQGLPFKLSTYYARHTWATIARNIGIPKDDIITALGHGDNTVTDAYIDIDYSRIDAANRRVIDFVKNAENTPNYG